MRPRPAPSSGAGTGRHRTKSSSLCRLRAFTSPQTRLNLLANSGRKDSGLPYLLHTPPPLLAHGKDTLRDPSTLLARHLASKRRAAVYQVLTTMLQLILTLQPSAPAIAYGRAGAAAGGLGSVYGGRGGGGDGGEMRHLTRAALGGPGLGPNGRPRYAPPEGGDALLANLLAQRGLAPPLAGGGPPPVPAGARRRATLSVVINVDAILSLFVPLFLLSLKLAFLLWIFGRNASPSKRIALGCVAALWVVYEGWAIQRRRAQATRERERAERDRRRAARAAAAAEGGGGGGGNFTLAPGRVRLPGAGPMREANRPLPPGGAGAGPEGAAPRRRTGAGATTRPHHHHHRTPASRLSPKYWLNLIAAVGLVAEARELGLSPRYIAGRPVAPAPAPPAPGGGPSRRTETLRRAGRNVLVAVVLFFGTLSPEVERKRKKAIEKRERLLQERRAAHARAIAVAAVQGADTGGAQQEVRTATDAGGARPRPVSLTGSDGADNDNEDEVVVMAAAPSAAPTTMSGAAPSITPPAGASAATPMSSSEAGPQGRARVSDRELFRDGGSEAYLATTSTAAATAPVSGSDASEADAAAAPSVLDDAAPPLASTSSSSPTTTAAPLTARLGENELHYPENDDDEDTVTERRLEFGVRSSPAAPPPGAAVEEGAPPSEDEDFASLTSTSTSTSASASSSSSAPDDDDDDNDGAGIARRVRARRARLLARQQQRAEAVGEGGRGRGEGGREGDQIDQVVALF